MISADLAAEIRASADQREQDRQLGSRMARKLAEADLFKLLVPACYGGLEGTPQNFVDVLIEGAKHDGAVGWCLMIGNTTSLLSASLPERWAREIYTQDPNVITCGVTAPYGRVTREANGLRISGRWPYGSASAVSEWISGGALIKEPGEEPRQILAFFHKDDVQLHDNWHTSGLRGTGSNDFSVTDILVPEGRWVTLGGRAQIDSPLYRFPTLGLLALGVAAVSVGIAQRAIEAFVELATNKQPTGSNRSLASRDSVQKDLAEAMGYEAAARAFMHSAIDELWQAAQAGDRITKAQKGQLRLAATHAAWQSATAVDLLYHAAGGSAIYETSVLQRCFRDVHVTTQHIMVAKPTYEMLGKLPLGFEVKAPL